MTKDDIIKLAREAGAGYDEGLTYFDESDLHRFANLVAAAQRESDAKLIEEYPYWIGANAKSDIAAAIRGTT